MSVLALSVPRYRSRSTLQLATARGAVFCGIVGLHVLAGIGVAAVRLRAPALVDAAPIDVVLVQHDTKQPPPEKLTVPLREIRVVDLVPPVVDIAVEVPTPAAITATVTPTPPPPVPTVEQPTLVTEVDYLRAPLPRYPPAAKRAHAEGTVYLRVLIDTEGKAREVLVHRTSGFAQLDAAARDAVRNWLFQPHRENGVLRNALAIVPVQFMLPIRTASAG